MTFEPLQLHQHVLDFYRGSGLFGSSPDRAHLVLHGPRQVCGAAQAFEQNLYLLLGHLLAHWDPLTGDMMVSTSRVEIRYKLVETGDSKIDTLDCNLKNDQHFQRLLQNSRASCFTQQSGQDPPVLRLDFPVGELVSSDSSAIINFNELEKRFETIENALPLLEWFVSDARHTVSLVSGHVERREWDDAHRLAHSLKGGAMNVGANTFALRAKDLELALKKQHFPAISDLVVQLEVACAEMEQTWQKHHGEFYG